ncbi:MAG: hypothetical protein GKR90_11385 [Pseudomonadales bacterium]|nr:hypothetical protein [Pseudomonadales bacterium]
MGNQTQVAILIVLLGLSVPGFAQDPVLSGIRTIDKVFQENCAVCHGERMQGSAQGTALVGLELAHGDSMTELTNSVSKGFPQAGMPAWGDVFTEQELKSMALWIPENRDGLLYSEFNLNSDLALPEEPIATEKYTIVVETLVDGLDPLPYSIAALPDGSLLLTEKMRGLRIISPEGEKSDFITGTPDVFDAGRKGGGGLFYGQGWLLDVAVHPNYAENGWIYLHHTDRCEDCNALSRKVDRSVSMNRIVRGRIKDGAWINEEVIWQADVEHYGASSDVASGGRTTFDPEGYVFFSVGMRNRDAIQNLAFPDGKIHRLHDDGRIPTDNPFTGHESALQSIWSYGHRSPQGLKFESNTRELWGTEHGPRGGDEINLLKPGKNYGWPLFSKGQNYNGSEVAHGRQESEVELSDIEQPVVDWTPSPAVSSFVFYRGDAFPAWQDDMLVGTLKAADFVRVKIVDGELVEQETLIADLSRIRDVEIDRRGLIYLLLEHEGGSKIVKVQPVDSPSLAGANQ